MNHTGMYFRNEHAYHMHYEAIKDKQSFCHPLAVKEQHHE